jgi:hypothetical protein
VSQTKQQAGEGKLHDSESKNCANLFGSWTTQEDALILLRELTADDSPWQTIVDKINAEFHNGEEVRKKRAVVNRWGNILSPAKHHRARITGLEYIIDNYEEQEEKAHEVLEATKATMLAACTNSLYFTAPCQQSDPTLTGRTVTTTHMFEHLMSNPTIEALFVGWMNGHVCGHGGLDQEKLISGEQTRIA